MDASTIAIVESLQQMAQKVQNSDPGGRDRLLMLGEAVKNNTHADAWAYADVRSMIAPDSIVECYRNDRKTSRSDRIVAILEGVRNALIFLPIMVTWFGISQATTAYNILIKQAVDSRNTDLYTQPFLYLWQQHFNNTLPDIWTLSSIATMDVLILLFILAITLIAFFIAHNNSIQKDEDARLLRARLNHAITGAILTLHSRPQLTAGDNLEHVARNLDGTVRHVINQVQKASEQSALSLDKMAQETTRRLEKVAVDTTDRFDKMARDLTGQFANASMQNRTQLDRIVQEIIRQVEAGKEYLTQLGSLTSGVVKTASELQATANILKTSNVSLINSVNNLVTPAKSLSEQQALLLDAVQKSVGLLQNTATSINNLASKQHTMSEDLSKTLDTLTLATESFATLGQEQSELVSQHAQFLQEMQEEHRKQGDLAVLLSDATVSTKNALSEINQGAINLRSIAVSMNDLMRLQASMVSNPGMPVAVDLSNITRSYENTAQSMENVSKTLTVSAFAIQKASQQLRDVLDIVQQTTARRP